jgi:AcrR family transcriptional regulator
MPSTGERGRLNSPDAEEFDEGRERLLAAATEVFGSVGFQKATIQDIVSQAGVSRPLFYRRFSDKTQVFEVVVDELITEWNETLVGAVSTASGGAAGALRVLHEASLAYGRARPLFHRLLTRDTQLLLSSQTDVIERGSRALRRLIEEILRRGIEQGEIRRDVAVEHMADLLTAIHLAYSDRVVIEDASLDPDLSEGIIVCMLSGVLAREP